MKKRMIDISIAFICLSFFIFSDLPKNALMNTILSFFVLYLLALILMIVISPEGADKFTHLITTDNEKYRILSTLFYVIDACLLTVSFEPILTTKWYKLYTGPFYAFNNNLGWTAIIILCFSFFLLPVLKLIRFNATVDKFLKELKKEKKEYSGFHKFIWNPYKKGITFLSKNLRKYHIPIALIGIFFVFYHVYLAIVSGIKWNLTFISGYLALFDLLIISVLGLLRFKKLDRNLHKYLTYVLILLLLLHYLFCKFRL